MKKLLMLVVCCFMVAGCASTKYAPAKKMTKYGYFDSNLQDNVYDVQFKANSHSDKSVIYDYCILRCCEVCLENNYKTFNVISQVNNTSVSSSVESGAYGYSNYAFGSSQIKTKYYPYYVFRIECFKDFTGSFKAEEIRNNLIKKHNIKSLKQKYGLN